MSMYIVWETWLKPNTAEQGLATTKQIWKDMLDFNGYEGHLLLRDEDDGSHLILVSLWETRAHADKARELYTGNALTALQPLLVKERARTVCDFEESNRKLIPHEPIRRGGLRYCPASWQEDRSRALI